MQRGPIYVVSRINVLNSPYLYKLSDIRTKKPLFGWYYGCELARADLSELEVERVIEERVTPDKRKQIYVKFKDLDESCNRWIEKPKDK